MTGDVPPPWTVLVLFRASGTGKSTVAAEIGRRCEVPWIQVDDLRLALQYSRVTLPERTEQFYFLEETPNVWARSPARLGQAFVDVAELMVPALRTVIHSHVLPALAESPLLRPLVDTGAVRFCCTATPGIDELVDNMLARGRGLDASTPDRPRAQTAANQAFGHWLEGEATRLGIPVVVSRPFDTFADRILDAIR